MNCPVCDVTLVVSSREGIEIDHCPQCRGVWLDRGELDKIIERATPAIVGGRGPEPIPEYRPRRDDRYRDDRYRDDRYRDDRYRDDDWDDDRRYRRRRRGGFLEELFDFD